MLKIRLMRIGGKKKPFYRVVAVDERNKRTGAYIELLGTYNPLTHPHEIKLKQDRIDYWIKQGAQMSTGFLRIIGKAPQRPPRKPKKEKVSKEAEVSKVSMGDKQEEIKTEESSTTKTSPVEVMAEEPNQKDVIASEAKQSSSEENSTQIASEPSAPRNDYEEKEQTDERSA